jgi:hypothetical protein
VRERNQSHLRFGFLDGQPCRRSVMSLPIHLIRIVHQWERWRSVRCSKPGERSVRNTPAKSLAATSLSLRTMRMVPTTRLSRKKPPIGRDYIVSGQHPSSGWIVRRETLCFSLDFDLNGWSAIRRLCDHFRGRDDHC